MKIINLYGAPGAGKSTTAARVFSELKTMGINCELCTEFAKDLVWAKRHDEMRNQIYLFAKQHHKLFRLEGQVDYVVTDSPLLLGIYYDREYGLNSTPLHDLILDTYNRYDNINVFINRVKTYNPMGRIQTEEESDGVGKSLEALLNYYIGEGNYLTTNGDLMAYRNVCDYINCLKNGE